MTDYGKFTDEELITMLRDGNEDSGITDYIMSKYMDLVNKNAKSMFIIGADKEDLIQEGRIGLFKAIRDYDHGYGASFYTFANTCISRQMLKAVEAGARKKHSPLNFYVSISEDTSFSTPDDNNPDSRNAMEALLMLSDKSPEELIIDQENVELLEAKIDATLSDFERQVLYLHLTGMGYVEMARILGKDEKSTDNALSRIKTKVKKILNNT